MKANYTFILITLFSFLICRKTHSQYLNNSSFEGPPGMAVSPPSWNACYSSTPDTQPGSFGVTLPPSHGNSYLGMVCRGDGFFTWEKCQQQLVTPLLQGSCYQLTMDLAYTDDFYGINWDTVWFDRPANLKIYGGVTGCSSDEYFWESGVIPNTGWNTYSTIIKPSHPSIFFLVLEAYYTDMPKYFGNILIDNLSLIELNSNVIKLDTLVAFGSHFTLNASPGISYAWSPADGLSCNDCQFPTLTVTNSATYIVTIVTATGCSYEETFQVDSDYNEPNIFTPNGDGLNDFLIFNGIAPNFSLVIYNRWGVVVWETTNYLNNWSGISKGGEILADGVYYYRLSSQESNVKSTGYIHLYR